MDLGRELSFQDKKGLKITVVNSTYHFINGESLELTSTLLYCFNYFNHFFIKVLTEEPQENVKRLKLSLRKPKSLIFL